MIYVYTSISFSYLSRARVLAKTLKAQHPNWHFTVLLTDREPPGFRFNIEKEVFDEVFWSEDLPINNMPSWLFKHDIVEVCTAVKGPFIELLTQRKDAEFIIYLDPDIAVLNSLFPLIEKLQTHSILLTPHQLEPEDNLKGIEDNEISSLAHGIYNLGFVAIKNDEIGKKFAQWWKVRLENYCYDDIPRGLFVDQKWCDLVPAMFDKVLVLRDPGYNVASWNISQRKISFSLDGTACANGKTLRFYHFTKINSAGDIMTQRYAKGNPEVYEIWFWYKRMLQENEEEAIPKGWWFFGQYSDGSKIQNEDRVLHRNAEARGNLVGDPFILESGSLFK